ncbi:hypothetical protein EHP00_1120 [Ecytonucleospora hepatopenaei]|uniref:Uncharacterized protein n=1 Tax=Ecytonucleospora hepatopenaei TaxID=646526 RepID=A0A1W0E4Y6_9MICR|nr:hypothetical protein EHP00_1120 [Ecytonucleospora hepatopenaei]
MFLFRRNREKASFLRNSPGQRQTNGEKDDSSDGEASDSGYLTDSEDSKPSQKKIRESPGDFHMGKIEKVDEKYRKRKRKIETSSELSEFFPKNKEKVTDKSTFYINPEGKMTKAYGPFSENPKSPYYWPGLHKLSSKVGKKVINDENYTFHPVFMKQLADGGWYERRVIKPKQEKGADIVEERFGYWPKNDKNYDSSEFEPRGSGRGSSYAPPGFNSYAQPNFFRCPLDAPYNIGTAAFAMHYVDDELDKVKEQRERDRKYYDEQTNALRDYTTRTTDKLNSDLQHHAWSGIKQQLNDLNYDMATKKANEYTDVKVKTNSIAGIMGFAPPPAGPAARKMEANDAAE